MLASSLAWANKKYSPRELANGGISVALPAVVKVTQVPESYGKSCTKMSVNTVLFIRGIGKEHRVALKTTDNHHYFSLPLDSPMKFRKVFLHDRGPAILLKNLMVGKVNADLKVEISGNEGDKLSSTPDMSTLVAYGSFQVIGLYTDTVLYAQAILKESGELNLNTRNVSVNCPAKFDIATGFLRRSQDEFKQFQEKLKKNQSTKTTTDQNETFPDLVLMSSPTRTTQEMQFLEHISHLYNGSSGQSKSISGDGKADEGATSIRDALEKLRQSSKQDNIPQVEKPVIKTLSKRSTILPSNGSLEKSKEKSDSVVYDDGTSNLRAKHVTDQKGCNTVDPVQYENSLEENKLSSKDKHSNTRAFQGSRPVGSSKEVPMASTYLNEGKIHSAANINSNARLAYECVDVQNVSHSPQHGTTVSLSTGEYLNGRKLQLKAEEKSKPKEDYLIECVYDDVPYDAEITPLNNVPLRSSDRLTMPLPAPPPPGPRSDGKKHRFSILSRLKPSNIMERFKTAVSSADEEMCDDEDYVDPDVPLSTKDVSGEHKWKTASEVPKNIKGFTIGDVALCLQLLNMERYIQKFRDRNVDGAFLVKIKKKMLVESFQMQEFEAKQLIEFAVQKWRPKK